MASSVTAVAVGFSTILAGLARQPTKAGFSKAAESEEHRIIANPLKSKAEG